MFFFEGGEQQNIYATTTPTQKCFFHQTAAFFSCILRCDLPISTESCHQGNERMIFRTVRWRNNARTWALVLLAQWVLLSVILSVSATWFIQTRSKSSAPEHVWSKNIYSCKNSVFWLKKDLELRENHKILGTVASLNQKCVLSSGPIHTGREQANLQEMPFIWCCVYMYPVWTHPFATAGSICLRLRLASSVDWASMSGSAFQLLFCQMPFVTFEWNHASAKVQICLDKMFSLPIVLIVLCGFFCEKMKHLKKGWEATLLSTEKGDTWNRTNPMQM